MTNNKTTQQTFDAKLSRLNALTALVIKIDEAILGEEPQMRKEFQKIKKLAETEMRSLHVEMNKIVDQVAKTTSNLV